MHYLVHSGTVMQEMVYLKNFFKININIEHRAKKAKLTSIFYIFLNHLCYLNRRAQIITYFIFIYIYTCPKSVEKFNTNKFIKETIKKLISFDSKD